MPGKGTVVRPQVEAEATTTAPAYTGSMIDALVGATPTGGTRPQTMTAALAGDFNASSNGLDFGTKLGASLGLEKSWMGGFVGGGFSEESHRELFRNKMEELGSEKSFDALIKASEGNPDQVELLEKVKSHPELAKSIHGALVKDPTTLSGMQEIFGQDADSKGLNVTDLNEALDSPIARDALKQVMDKVADGSTILSGPNKGEDIQFSHVHAILKDYKGNNLDGVQSGLANLGIDFEGANIDFGEFFRDLMQNPEMAMNNLVNQLVELGQIDPEMANMMKGFLVPLGGFTKFMIEPYHAHAEKYNIGPNTPEDYGRYLDGNGQITTKQYGAPKQDNRATNTTNGVESQQVAIAKRAADTGTPANGNEEKVKVGNEETSLANDKFNPAVAGETPTATNEQVVAIENTASVAPMQFGVR